MKNIKLNKMVKSNWIPWVLSPNQKYVVPEIWNYTTDKKKQVNIKFVNF